LKMLAIIAFVCSEAQNVGIGTTEPHALLHIQVTPSYPQPALLINIKDSVIPHLVITPNGRVGVKVINPSEVLDIGGNIRFSGALMPAGNAGTSGQVLISQGPGTSPLWVDAPSIGDDWGSQVAITQNPVVGNGTTGNPITLQGGTTAGDLLIWDGSQWQIQQPGPSTGLTPLCNSPSTNVLPKWTGTQLCNSQIYDNGTNVGIGTTSPSYKLHVNGRIKSIGINETSDKRLKTNIRDIDSALNAVLNLQGVYYEWKDSLVREGYPEGTQAGFIAQEVLEVLPMVVEQDQQGYYSVEYTRIVPFLVEAIKALEKRVSQLEEENKMLNKRVNSHSSNHTPIN